MDSTYDDRGQRAAETLPSTCSTYLHLHLTINASPLWLSGFDSPRYNPCPYLTKAFESCVPNLPTSLMTLFLFSLRPTQGIAQTAPCNHRDGSCSHECPCRKRKRVSSLKASVGFQPRGRWNVELMISAALSTRCFVGLPMIGSRKWPDACPSLPYP